MFGWIAPPPSPVQELKIEVVRQLSYEHRDRRLPLRRVAGTTALFFQSKMSCDVDGSPNAYHPLDDNLALDMIGSAGGRRWGDLPSGPLEVLPGSEVVVYQNGAPYVQTSGEFKGFYVSETSYRNLALPETDPNRYLDARSAHYIVLPGGLVPEARVGDLAVVYDPYSGNSTFAIFGDIGPSSESGEASLGTIKGLSLPVTDGKSSPGQCRDDLFYLVFPNTADLLEKADEWPHAQATIDSLAGAQFAQWGGVERIRAILAKDPQGGSLQDNQANGWIFDEMAWWRHQSPAPPEFALPARYGFEKSGRLPCAPEVVVTAQAAFFHIQRQIGDIERGAPAQGSPPPTELKIRLGSIMRVLNHFPVESADEGISLLKEQARVTALCDRIDALKQNQR